MVEAFSYALVNEGNEFTHNADRFEAEFLPLPSLHKSLEMTLTVLDLATQR